MPELTNSQIIDKFILNELRHSLANYTYYGSPLRKGAIITVRHAINTFFDGQFDNEGLCDISVNRPNDIPEKEWMQLRLNLMIFINNKLDKL